MKVIIRSEYGGSEKLSVGELPTPSPGKGQVLIRVKAVSINQADCHMLHGRPFPVRFMLSGFPKPKLKVLGADVAGIVEAVGPDVADFKMGDEVMGDLSGAGFGGFAEYAVAPVKVLAPKPPEITFVQAASLPMASCTALQALRKVANVQPGQRVLVNGAGGGIGSFAVQLAKALGAHVTGVCSTGKVDVVRSLGADEVVDYTKADVTEGTARFDAVIDTAANRSIRDYAPILTDTGIYVLVGGDALMQIYTLGPFISKRNGKRFKNFLALPDKNDLSFVGSLAAEGKVVPNIGQIYPFHRIPEAVAHVDAGHANGKVVGTIESIML